jgi:hypothetical protein
VDLSHLSEITSSAWSFEYVYYAYRLANLFLILELV